LLVEGMMTDGISEAAESEDRPYGKSPVPVPVAEHALLYLLETAGEAAFIVAYPCPHTAMLPSL
jgi:hypothetical protein